MNDNPKPFDSPEPDPVALDGLPYCPVCGLGQWAGGRCIRCRGGVGALGVVERVFCRSTRHEKQWPCPECGRRKIEPALVSRAVTTVHGDPPEVVVLDTETTGRKHGYDRVIQIACAVVTLPRCEVAKHAVMLCMPGIDIQTGQPVPIHWAATQVHGFLAHHLAGKPTFEEILPRVIEWIGGRPIVAHNASFDATMIREAIDRAGVAHPKNEIFCTLKLARRLLPTLHDHKLGTLAKHYRIDAGRAHRAEADVSTTVALLAHLLTLCPEGLRKAHGETDKL